MDQDAWRADDGLLVHFAPFFRTAAEEGLGLAACEMVLTLLRPIVPYELGTLWLRHGDTYRPGASVGRPFDLMESMPFAGGSGLAAWIAESGRSVLVPSASRGFRQETLRSFLGVPLRAGGEPQGAIALGHTVRVFDARERDQFEAVAALLSPAIRHGRIASRLRALAMVDPLTELFNRRYFLQRLEEEIAEARSTGGGVGMLLVSFAAPAGAMPGGRWLARIVGAFRAVMRPIDVLARWDAMVLAVMLPGRDLPGVARITGHLVRELQGSTTAGPGDRAFTIHTAAFPSNGQTVEALVDACSRSVASAEGISL